MKMLLLSACTVRRYATFMVEKYQLPTPSRTSCENRFNRESDNGVSTGAVENSF